MVVRLEFGSLVTTHMSREEALRTYGFDVPVKWTVTVLDPEKPGVDVEIYRPLATPGKETAAASAGRYARSFMAEQSVVVSSC